MTANRLETRWVSDSNPFLNVRQFVPDQSVYAERIPEKKWTKVQPDLKVLHAMGVTRARMLEVLGRTHDFHPTLNQLNARMVSWGYRVHNTQSLVREAPKDQQQTFETMGQDMRTTGDVAELQRRGQDDVVHAHTTPSLASHNLTSSTTVRYGPKDTVVDATGDVSHHENVTNVTKLIERRVFEQLKTSTHLDESQSFCILYDITDFLAHSAWYNGYAYLLVRALMRSVREEVVALTGMAHLLMIRDCLYWSSGWKDESILDLLSSHLQDVEDDPSFDKDRVFLSALSECYTIASERYPHKNWKIKPGSEKHKFLCQDEQFQVLSINNALMHSTGQTLVVKPGSEHSPGSIFQWIMPGLAKWCATEVNEFRIRLNKVHFDDEYPNELVRYYCCAELTRFLLKQWIQYTNHAAKQLIAKTHLSSYTVSEVTLFKLIAQVLALLSYQATEGASAFFRTIPNRYDIKNPDWIKDSDFKHQVAEVLASTISESQVITDRSLCEFPMKILSAVIGSQRQDLLDDVIEVSSIVAQEFSYVRQNPSVPRHCAGLEFPVIKSKVRSCRPLLDSCLGADAMLVDSATSSSLGSFCAAGIKVKDKFGPSSDTSSSSIFSRVFREHCSDVLSF